MEQNDLRQANLVSIFGSTRACFGGGQWQARDQQGSSEGAGRILQSVAGVVHLSEQSGLNFRLPRLIGKTIADSLSPRQSKPPARERMTNIQLGRDVKGEILAPRRIAKPL